jgi:hypothetical protein
MSTTTRRSTRSKAKPQTAAKATKPIRFEAMNDTDTGTNEHHIKLLLGELPWMRMGAVILNLNDRELEAKLYGTDEETQHSFCKLMEALMEIRNRYQAGIDICEAVCMRLLVVFHRLQAEGKAKVPPVSDELLSLALRKLNPTQAVR